MEDWGHRYGEAPSSLWQNTELGLSRDRRFQTLVGPHLAGSLQTLQAPRPQCIIGTLPVGHAVCQVPALGEVTEYAGDGTGRSLLPVSSRPQGLSRGLGQVRAGCWNREGTGTFLTHTSF